MPPPGQARRRPPPAWTQSRPSRTTYPPTNTASPTHSRWARQLVLSGSSLPAVAEPLPRRALTSGVTGSPKGRVLVVRRQIEQANVVLGTTGLTATDPRRYVMSVLNAVLGGGMSSRLFQ